jgi:tetratricopeptide (TPR) repeat protein
MQRILYILFLFPTLLNSQEGTFDYKAQEAKIVKYIYSQPDSTKAVIEYVLSQKNLPDSLRGTIYNVYGIYYTNLGKTDSSLIYYKKSVAQLRNYPRIRTMPLMNMSIAYRNRGEYTESFKYLEQALEINKKLGLKVSEAMVYSNMSSNYQFTEEYDKAVKYLLLAIDIVKKEGDMTYLVNLNQKLANTYMKLRNFTFAKDMYEECLAEFRAQNDNVNHALTLINYAECVIHMGELDNAKKSLRAAIKELDGYKNRDHLAVAYSKLANIAKHEKRSSDAHKNYKAALKIMKEMNSLNIVMIGAEYLEFLNAEKNFPEGLKIIEFVKTTPIYHNATPQDKARLDVAAAETYKNTNNDKKALEGLLAAIKIKDSLAAANNEDYTKELQAKFQTQLQNEKKAALKTKNDALQAAVDGEHTLLFIYGALSLLAIILILVFLRSYWLSNNLQRVALKQAEAEKSLALQQHLHEQELTNAQRQQIHEKERELTSTTLKMAHYQNNLQEIIEKCEAEALTKIPEVKKELQMLMKQKEYWKQFETRFNNLHPEFGHTLINRYDQLTKSDVEFCSLLKLNLSNKEISSLLQISYESTLTKKYRIKKKMQIQDDEEFEKLLAAI